MSIKIEPYKNIARIYDEIRPSYPDKLIDDIVTKTKIDVDSNILEIGAGTGKATILMAKRGFKVHAIELGEDMAAIFKENLCAYDNVKLNVCSFEQWINKDNKKFDLVYCAQAFHWLDPKIKYVKCHDLLNKDGYLVLFWYNSYDDSTLGIKIQNQIQLIIHKYVANYYVSNNNSSRTTHDGVYKEDERIKEIQNSGLFTLVDKIEYVTETKNNADQYFKVLTSTPVFATILDGLDDKNIINMTNEIKDVIKNYGGYVKTYLKYSLYITKKIGG
jgi:SAM-dependent methyltransferase